MRRLFITLAAVTTFASCGIKFTESKPDAAVYGSFTFQVHNNGNITNGKTWYAEDTTKTLEYFIKHSRHK